MLGEVDRSPLTHTNAGFGLLMCLWLHLYKTQNVAKSPSTMIAMMMAVTATVMPPLPTQPLKIHFPTVFETCFAVS